MRTQNISSSDLHFNGKLYFLEKTNAGTVLSEDIGKYISNFSSEHVAAVREALAGVPYDLFVSASKDMKDFYNVSANVKVENIIGSDTSKQAKIVILNKNKPERFPNAAIEAMLNFEKLPNYEELITRKFGFWDFLSNLINR